MLVGIFINVILISLACWIVGRHEADFNFPKLMIVSAVIALVQVGLGFSMMAMAEDNPLLGLGLVVGLTTAISAIAFHFFLYLQLRNAIIAAVIFFVLRMGVAILIGL